MDVLITGATGLIGQHLVPALRAAHEVWAVARRERPADVRADVHWITTDVATPRFISDLPPRADVVVHLAQSAHYRDFPEHALDVFEVNVASTARLLDWSLAAGVRQFILASSGGIAAATALSHYLASKRSAELLAQSYASKLRVLVLRFFFVYGRGQKPWMLVPRLAESIRTHRSVALAGANGPRLNPVHVGDAVRAIVTAIDRQADGCIDIAGPESLTVRDMCEAIAAQYGCRPQFAPDSAAESIDLLGDVGPMSARLVAPERRFSDAIAETIAAGEGRLR